MTVRIKWHAHSAFFITSSGLRIYLDPYQLIEPVPADVIFLTHPHVDHVFPTDLKKICTPETVVVAPFPVPEWVGGKPRRISCGETAVIEGISVTAIPAYNTNKLFHPREAGWAGFLLTVGGVTLYHAGDTDLIPEMKGIRADVALVPVSGGYTMTAEEAARAVESMSVTRAVPMHFGLVVGRSADARRFADLCPKPVLLPQRGEWLEGFG